MARWDSARRALLTVASLSALASAASMTTSAGGGIMMPPPPPPHPRDDDDVARIVPRPALPAALCCSRRRTPPPPPPPPPRRLHRPSSPPPCRRSRTCASTSRGTPRRRASSAAANVDLSLDALGELPPVEKALVITGAACASDPALGANCAVSAWVAQPPLHRRRDVGAFARGSDAATRRGRTTFTLGRGEKRLRVRPSHSHPRRVRGQRRHPRRRRSRRRGGSPGRLREVRGLPVPRQCRLRPGEVVFVSSGSPRLFSVFVRAERRERVRRGRRGGPRRRGRSRVRLRRG